MDLSRRHFVRAGSVATLAFVAGGKTLWLTPAQARAEKLAYQVLTPIEARTLDRLGEMIVPGAANAGLSHYVDQQLSATVEDCMLMIRYLGVEAPYRHFYQQSLKALDGVSQHRHNKLFDELPDAQAIALVDAMAGQNPEQWQGPPAPFFFFVLRNDACDLVFGTEEGFANLNIPYMAHIRPPSPW